MRYLLIDHIAEWKSGEMIRGTKNVAMSEDFLEFHFPKNPIMPGVMLLEAITQLTGWLEAASSDFTRWFLIASVKKCNFYGFAFPGDQVELTVEFLSISGDDKKTFRGTGTVKGKKKITVEFEGDIISLEEFEDPREQRKFFDVLTRGMAV
ncbi:MAG: beta-hydroxyacyl-ACP dehydratase [Nitrospirae bacterium]|nr:beta-hydroxyacyl-ACP dehydratase [Nitrospirota bacterium]